MSDGDDLIAELNAGVNGDGPDPAVFLTEQLGVIVTAARVFGRGPTARVDLELIGHRPLTFERFGDIAKPAVLTTYLVTALGIYRTFKAPEAGMIATAIHRLATHHAEDEADEHAREWGREYLRTAPTFDVDMTDQASRWQAFSALEGREPAKEAGDDRSAYALAVGSLVLADHGGQRFVRTGWLQAYVKREVGGLYSPAALATQMEAVGWKRPNSQGRIKATNPADNRQLSWSFYVVEAGWVEYVSTP